MISDLLDYSKRMAGPDTMVVTKELNQDLFQTMSGMSPLCRRQNASEQTNEHTWAYQQGPRQERQMRRPLSDYDWEDSTYRK